MNAPTNEQPSELEQFPTASLSVEHVTKIFPSQQGEIRALEDVSISIREGEFVCFVGASGCGKSTLLNIIAGLEKPDSGRAIINGSPITGPGRDRLVMFQEHALFPWLNVIQNVKFGMEIAGVPKQEQEEKALKYLLRKFP